jgi:hypothetical protein
MKRPYGAKQASAKQMADEPMSAGMRMADGGMVEADDVDDYPLMRQQPGFLPANTCDETQGPGVRSLQDYKK